MSIELDEPYLHPRIQIHDDLTFIWPDSSRAQDYADTVFKLLAEPEYPWIIVPIMVEGEVGETWDSVEPFGKYEGRPYAN